MFGLLNFWRVVPGLLPGCTGFNERYGSVCCFLEGINNVLIMLAKVWIRNIFCSKCRKVLLEEEPISFLVIEDG